MGFQPIQPEASGQAGRMLLAIGRIPRWIGNEVVSILPALLFFLFGFMLVLLVIKLFLAQYSIGFEAFPEAVLGALLAAKAVMILDHRDYARLRRFPRVYAVVGKTAIYVLVVFAFGIAERVIHGYRQTGSLRGGILFFLHRSNHDRFFGTMLCVAIVFAAYFVIREIERKHGKGSMYDLFFRKPPALDVENPPSAQAERKSALG
jgi:hypothetical protein